MLAFVLLGACDGNDKGPGSDDSGTTPTTPTDFDGFLPVAFGITAAEFAVDAEGRAGGWLAADDTPRPARMTLSIADATVAGAGWVEGHYCEVSWEWTEPTPASGAPDTQAWSRWNPPTADVTDTCAALEFPPRWEGDVAAVVGRSVFGIGVGPLDPGVRAALEESFGTSFPDLEPYIGGGGFWWDGLLDQERVDVPDAWRETGWVDTSVVYTFELDAAGREVLIEGSPVTLRTEGLWEGGRLAQARYQLQGTALLTPATALDVP
jgi:hypothetical protein